LSKASKVPALEKEYTLQFPASHPIDIGDETLSSFRGRLLERIASDLAIKFIPHATSHFPVD
jgi:hypothetical protein